MKTNSPQKKKIVFVWWIENTECHRSMYFMDGVRAD